MSDEPEVLWAWQGWEGPLDVATAAKLLTDQDVRGGAWVPEPGEPPEIMDVNGSVGMFAVMTRPWAPIPCPEGMTEMRPDIVGRMFGA
jgi:hypothetical protein